MGNDDLIAGPEAPLAETASEPSAITPEARAKIAELTDLAAREIGEMSRLRTALAERDATIERLTREKEEALKELHMKWCMACGTLTNDDDCDCTMYSGDASLQDLRPYIEEYQNSMRECLSEAEARATTA